MSAGPVLLATRNGAKLRELRRILRVVSDLELLGLADVTAYDEVPETGDTFADNALLKAREGARQTGLVTIADDSGLTVDALGGMPGVLSARWAGGHGDDEANLRLVLAHLADVPDERRGAHFVCAAVAVTPDGRERVEHGQLDGILVRGPRGGGGFGYDPIFRPLGECRTTAEMTAAEKDAISHRAKAFRALAPLVATLVG
ncbi:MAG: RdgB/HAM1 family non-canonical purine NTP pyrophosphatase [Mycobacteriales bacterium]